MSFDYYNKDVGWAAAIILINFVKKFLTHQLL